MPNEKISTRILESTTPNGATGLCGVGIWRASRPRLRGTSHGSPRRLLLCNESSCVRREVPVHTGGGWWRVLGAETASSAHGRVLNKGVVCVEMLFCIQEVVSGDCWVRKQPQVHTEGVILKVQ